MTTRQTTKERIEIPLTAETLSADRVAYLERLVSNAKTAAALFTQFILLASHNKGIGNIWRHRIGCHFGSACFLIDIGYFGKQIKSSFHIHLHFSGLGQ